MALEYNFLGLMPVSIFHRALQIGAMMSIEVLEDPVLILQTSVGPLRRIVDSREISPLMLRRGGGGRKS